MKIKNIKGSAILAEESYVKQEYLTLNLKFFRVTAEELEWLWKFIKQEFYIDIKEEFLLRFGSEEKNVKEKYVEQFLLRKQDINDIWADGIYRDARFGNIRSVSGAEKFLDERCDKNEEHINPASKQERWKSRVDFKDDEEFLQYVRKSMNKESKPVMADCVWPDISWEFCAERYDGIDEFYGKIEWSIAGEVIRYSYNEMAQELWEIFSVICRKLKQIIGNVYLMPFSTSNGAPFCEVFRDGIRERYGELPERLFLLGGIEWLNYVPHVLMTNCRTNLEEFSDLRIIIKECENGCFFVVNKLISEITIEDKKYLRQNYLDRFLMKGRDILDENIGPDSYIKEQGMNLPIFDEELQLYIGTEFDGTTVYGVEYVPIDFPSLLDTENN